MDSHIKIMPPLDGVINELYDRLSAVEKDVREFNSQVAELGKDLAKLYGKINRIEKYAK